MIARSQESPCGELAGGVKRTERFHVEHGVHSCHRFDGSRRDTRGWLLHDQGFLGEEVVMTYVIFGCVVVVIGVLGAVFRKPLAAMAAKMSGASGIKVDQDRMPLLERGYGLGGIAMAVLGVVTVIYGLIAGQ